MEEREGGVAREEAEPAELDSRVVDDEGGNEGGNRGR